MLNWLRKNYRGAPFRCPGWLYRRIDARRKIPWWCRLLWPGMHWCGAMDELLDCCDGVECDYCVFLMCEFEGPTFEERLEAERERAKRAEQEIEQLRAWMDVAIRKLGTADRDLSELSSQWLSATGTAWNLALWARRSVRDAIAALKEEEALSD